MMILGRCDVTPLVVTRYISCFVTLRINSLAGTHMQEKSHQTEGVGRAPSVFVYIKDRDFS